MNKLSYIFVVLICTVGFAQTDVYTSFSTGEVSPDMRGRVDARKYYSSCRILENFFVWAQGPVEKRRGTYFVAEVGGEIFPAVPAVPPTAATYKVSYFSEVGAIWGIPLSFSDYTTLVLDAGGIARDVGGGIVGLPCLGQPFVSGQVIRIEGSTYYNGLQTLTSGTTSSELQFTDTFNVETFDGSETVVQYISLSSGAGRMAQDDDGNLYFGTFAFGGSGSCITKISADGTIDDDFFSPTTGGFGGTYTDKGWRQSTGTMGVKVSTNSDYLYVYTADLTIAGRLYKFDLSDGSEIWQVLTGGSIGYNIDIDSDDNVYVCNQGVPPAPRYSLVKFTAADGTKSNMTLMGEPVEWYILGGGGVYDVHVDSDMGKVIVGGRQYYLTAGKHLLYNLAIRDLDNSDGAHIALGGTYDGTPIWYTYTIGTGFITSYRGYIYVLCNHIVYKLDTDLNIIAQTATITYAIGLFVDLEGHIVVVYQDYGIPQDDIFWFYDANLNYITKTEHNYYDSILSSWGAYIGGSWIQGNVVFDGALGIAGTPRIPAVVAFSNGLAEVPPARLLPFDGDAYVIEAGAGYMRFYKDTK